MAAGDTAFAPPTTAITMLLIAQERLWRSCGGVRVSFADNLLFRTQMLHSNITIFRNHPTSDIILIRLH